MNAIPSPQAIRAQLEAIERKEPDPRRVALSSFAPVRMHDELRTSSGPWKIEFCPTSLAFRERLARLDAEDAPRAVLLTPCTKEELGDDVLAYFVRQKLFDAKPREMVKERFELRQIDPRLELPEWFAECLLAAVPQGAVLCPGGFLDAESAWGIVLRERLRLLEARPDLGALLAWAGSAEALEAWRALPSAECQAISAWIEESAGKLGRALLAKIAEDPRFDPLAWGLVAELAEGGAERVLGLLQGGLGAGELGAEAFRLYFEAARERYQRLRSDAREIALRAAREAERLIESFGLASCFEESSLLPEGWKARLRAFATALQRLLGNGASGALAPERVEVLHRELEAALRKLGEHVFAGDEFEAPRLQRCRMALRLARALEPSLPTEVQRAGLAELAQRYEREGLWIDRARAALIPSDSEAALASVYQELLQRSAARREAENRRFAEALAEATANGGGDRDLLPIEDLLRECLPPLAKEVPVLVLVLDGASWPVAVELVESAAERWELLAHEQLRLPRTVIAALPTVTEVSRASLLCGELTVGGQDAEKKGFAAIEELRKCSSSRKPPRLFHQLSLGHRAGELDPDLRNALADDEQRIVGVVVNAIDDTLEKGDQIELRWDAATLPLFFQLLQLAYDQGRAILLTSDHGHVREHQTRLVSIASAAKSARADGEDAYGERYRAALGTPGDGELLLRGSRVSASLKGAMIAPWSERLRYGKVKRGYHGGVSPQEVLVPLFLLAPAGEIPNGWRREEKILVNPRWWDDAEAVAASTTTLATANPKTQRPTRRTRKPDPEDVYPALFPTEEPRETAPAAPPSASASPAWLDQLPRTKLWKEQVLRARANERDAKLVLAIVTLLASNRGKLLATALASRLEIPAVRQHGVLAMARRLLNVEGYAILGVEGEMVVLEEGVLREQFGVGG